MTPGGEATLDVTTTSVGRSLLIDTYTSFFRWIRFSGSFRVIVTIDPAYGISDGERCEVEQFLQDLPSADPRVASVTVERFDCHQGLETSLFMLFAHCRSEFGVHLEDDWIFEAPVDLDALLADLDEQGSTEVVFASDHAALGGTFSRDGEVIEVPSTRVPLLRLLPTSWAANYLPLSPHVHRTSTWVPTVVRALRTSDSLRCPDERVKEHVIATGTYALHNALWTRDVVVRDVGRSWLRAQEQFKAIVPGAPSCADDGGLTGRDGSDLRLFRSEQLASRAERLVPGLTHTYMKRPENFAPKSYPIYLDRGQGAVVWDVDGNAYVDFVCGLGAISLGHNHPVVTRTVHERVGKGVLFSLPAASEVSAAAELVEALPDAEMVRFLKTGADACAAALRLARHVTGRDEFVQVGYHGWHDAFLPGTPGVPSMIGGLTSRLRLDDGADDEALLELVARRGDRLSAVLLAVPYHRILPAAVLHALRQECTEHGTLLIFDEIVTGFRIAMGGAHEFYNVAADLACYAKGIANGMPVAAVAGPASLMKHMAETHVSSTYAGEVLSLEVLRATLREYRAGAVLEHFGNLGRRLRDGINAVAAQRGCGPIVVGYDEVPCFRFAEESSEHARRAERFVGAMARRGFLFSRNVNFVTAAHSVRQVDAAIDAFQASLEEAAIGLP